MKTISFDELKLLDEDEIIFVNKNAIYVRIIKYESLKFDEFRPNEELEILMRALSKMLKIEQEINRSIQCVEMTVSEIQKCFVKENFPKSTFVQYK